VKIFDVQETPEVEKLEGAFEGFPVVVRRNYLGSWCGYLGVPLDHPWAETEEDYPNVDVHGGCTFTSRAHPISREEGLFWVGFDCAHSFDAPPPWMRRELGSNIYTQFHSGVYRTLGYVEDQLIDMVRQAKEAK